MDTKKLLAALAGSFVFALPSDSATITGTVQDSSGDAVAGAIVRFTSDDTPTAGTTAIIMNTTKTVRASASGTFSIVLEEGNYVVQTDQPNYSQFLMYVPQGTGSHDWVDQTTTAAHVWNGVLTIGEVDGSPSFDGVTNLVVSNGTLVGTNKTVVLTTGGGGGGGSIDIKEGDATVVGTAAGLDFVAADFDITDQGSSEAGAAIAAAITRDAEWDTAAEINAATTDTDMVLDTDIGSTVQAWDTQLDSLALGQLGLALDVNGYGITNDASGIGLHIGTTVKAFSGILEVSGSLDLNDATDATIARNGAGDIQVEGNRIYRVGGGDVVHEDGGLEADVSAYTGLLAVSGGATSEVDAKSELEAQIADVADFAEADGDTWTGVHDAGGATSFEIPNAAAPTVNSAGEIAVDTTITDHTGLIKYYDGTEELTGIAVPTANLTTTDDQVLAYDAAADEFYFKTDATGAGGSAITLDLGDDSGNDSTDLTEIATSGDSNNIFTEPSADKLLIDVSQNWPVADQVPVVDSTDSTSFVAIFDSATGDQAIKTDAGLTYNASTGALTPTSVATTTTTTDTFGVNDNVDQSHYASFVVVSDLTANRNINLTTGDAQVDVNLTEAGADRLFGYDNTAGTWEPVTIGSGLSYDGTTLSASGGGSGTMTTVKEAGVQVGGADIVTLDFGAGFDVSETPDTEVNITLDYTEDPVDLASSEVTGVAPDANVSDTLTIGSGSTITLPQSAAPTPTAEGRIEWDTDDNKIIVGDGSGQRHFIPTTSFASDITVSTTGSATIQANAVALATDTTGTYVSTVADAGSSRITVSGSGSENAAVTLDIANLAVDTAQLAADAVEGTKIADDQINSEHYVAASIDNEHLADDAADSAEIAAGAIDDEHLSAQARAIFTEALGTAHTVSISATTGEGYGSVHYITAAVTITLPAVTDGACFTFISTGANTVTIELNASDLFYLDGTALDDGDTIDSPGAAGDICTIIYRDGTGWFVTSNTWTDGGAT